MRDFVLVPATWLAVAGLCAWRDARRTRPMRRFQRARSALRRIS